MTTDADWEMFKKLVQLVREHKADDIQTKIGNAKIRIHRLITTIRIDLQEVA